MLVLGLALCLAAEAGPAPPRTLRLDYVHSGSATEERFALDGLVLEGPWPGRLDRALDDSGLGKYFFEVADAQTGRPLYSRGFASIYGEWETTEEAKRRARVFHESLRFPAPAAPVTVVLRKRGPGHAFRDVWSLTVDPADPAIDLSPPPPFRVWAVHESGAPRDKVDLVLLGDGYTAAEMPDWHRDARRLAEMLFAVPPFKERRGDFNVWAVDTPAAQSGVSRPSNGVHRRSPLRVSYDAFGSERYVLGLDNKRLREAASAAPYEFIEIAVNERKYGGGGIHNLYATVAAKSAWAPYLFVHEFGHHFAGLADEYYTSPVAYAAAPEGARAEPWEANASADPWAAKWNDLVTPGTPLPTPWPKDAFEEAQREIQARRRSIREEKRPEEEMDALFREERRRMTRLLHGGAPTTAVGAFEGAMYESRGYYRPQVDCIMFSRNEVPFCAPCRRAIERVIDLYTRPPGP
ncbi:MAG TPA: IgA Peptidase M64 [Vicinamibacteria bacterium]|nr:IgA Peptidase M64 [Vicinamibacteria bacterium]